MLKNFKIQSKDTKLIFILKMLYIIPFIIVLYLPCIVYYGCKEIGNPFKGMIDDFKRRK